MRFVSLFSGIGGFDLAFERAGMECVAQVEIDSAASNVLARHFPTVPRFKDVRDVGRHNLPTADVLCGGFPCQDLSVAGNRAGLAGSRSGLWFEFHRIIFETRPRYVVIENVPGLLSSGPKDEATGKTRKGIDLAIVLAGLTGVVPTIPDNGWGNAGFMRGRRGFYNVAWRVLDAQYFGVAQRRRRVFLVASLGSGCCAEILFERDGSKGDLEARGEAGQGTAATLSASAPSRRNGGSDPTAGHFVYDTTQITSRENGSNPQANAPSHPLAAHQHAPLVVGTLAASGAGTMRPAGQKNELDFLVTAEALDVRNLRSNGEISGTLQSKATGGYSLNYQNPILTTGAQTERLRAFGDYEADSGASTLKARDGKDATDLVIAFDYKASAARQQPVRQHHQAGTLATTRQEAALVGQSIRRLTPVECERLQGFPEIEERITVTCLDNQKSLVLAVTQSPRKQWSVGSVESAKLPSNAKSADANFNPSYPSSNEPALLNVLIDFVESRVEIHSQEKSLLSARIAGRQNQYPPHISTESFAQAVVGMSSTLERIALNGRGVSQANEPLSTHPLSGKVLLRQSGSVTMPPAKDVASATTTRETRLRYTISSHSVIESTERKLITSFSSVMDVINGFTPMQTSSESSYRIEFVLRYGWTTLDADGNATSDTARYRQLGNAVAVPPVFWIGDRLMKAEGAQ